MSFRHKVSGGLGLRALGPGSGLGNQGSGVEHGAWGLQIVLELPKDNR